MSASILDCKDDYSFWIGVHCDNINSIAGFQFELPDNLELLDKVIKSPYLEKLDNLFKGDLDAITINTYLTTNTRDLFQPEFLNEVKKYV